MAEGWEFVNGGAFGMEGGIAVTLALGAALGILLFSMKKHGYFVEVAPGDGNQPPRDNHWGDGNQPPKNISGGFPFRNVSGLDEEGKRQPENAGYENMGLNPEETPWRPKEGEGMEQGAATGFDQSYFKD